MIKLCLDLCDNHSILHDFGLIGNLLVNLCVIITYELCSKNNMCMWGFVNGLWKTYLLQDKKDNVWRILDNANSTPFQIITTWGWGVRFIWKIWYDGFSNYKCSHPCLCNNSVFSDIENAVFEIFFS